eukprot:s2470_g5.t1
MALVDSLSRSDAGMTEKARMMTFFSFIENGPLDMIMGTIVISNAAVMFVQSQWLGALASDALGLTSGAAASWGENTGSTFETIETVYIVIYMIELVVRIVVLRRGPGDHRARGGSAWAWTAEGGIQYANLMDAVITTISAVSTFLLSQSDMNLSVARAIRLLRLTRTLRVMRVMILFRPHDPQTRLTNVGLLSRASTFLASIGALFWSMILLMILKFIGGLLLAQSLHSFILDEQEDMVDRVWMFDYYGSAWKAVYSMFELTHSGGWPNYARPVVEKVSIWYAWFFMPAAQTSESWANESWLRDTITNSCEETGEVGDTERCLFDLVIVTRKRSGPGGKLDIAHKVFPSAEFLILDDQVEVIAEFIRLLGFTLEVLFLRLIVKRTPVPLLRPPCLHVSPVSDPRVDQLIEVVQQLVQQVGQNATDHGETNDDDDVVGEEEAVKELREKDIVDQRALLHLKLEPVPSDAASFRSWKNGFKADLQDSELLPRLDAWIAGELSSGRVLKQSSELEQDITTYIEKCGQLGQSPKGRVMLSIIARHYDLDRVRGSVLTASTLFQIELGGNSIKDLRDFVNRIRLVLSAIPIGQRPDDRLTGEWLFHRVKHIRKLERVIEDIRESGSTSSRRDWSYLWDKIQDLIVQDREDSNAQSVLKSLQSATPAPKTKAVPAIDGGNGKTKASPPAAPKTKAAPTKVDPPPPPIAPGAPAPNAAKPKTKAKAKAKAMTDAEKAKTPCIFFQMPSGCIHGDNCKFNAPKPKLKPKTELRASLER